MASLNEKASRRIAVGRTVLSDAKSQITICRFQRELSSKTKLMQYKQQRNLFLHCMLSPFKETKREIRFTERLCWHETDLGKRLIYAWEWKSSPDTNKGGPLYANGLRPIGVCATSHGPAHYRAAFPKGILSLSLACSKPFISKTGPFANILEKKQKQI